MTRPDLFRAYLTEQIGLLIENHGVPVEIGESDEPIPIHFAYRRDINIAAALSSTRLGRDATAARFLRHARSRGHGRRDRRRHAELPPGAPEPLALFRAARVDYSLHRLYHYTGTDPEHFQNFVIFTNYQFYVDAFAQLCRERMASGEAGAEAFVEPGNVDHAQCAARRRHDRRPRRAHAADAGLHLVEPGYRGITLINIGTGPSNARNITDHVAVLRPHAWLMLGHCAGLRNTQRLGDYVLAHGYVREDHVLDRELPLWVPIPALAEMQVALEQAVGEVTGLDRVRAQARDAHRHRGQRRQPQLGALRSRRDHPPPVAVARDRARHGIGDHRRQRLSASASPTARCFASPTSRCTARSSSRAWPANSTASASASISRSA